MIYLVPHQTHTKDYFEIDDHYSPRNCAKFHVKCWKIDSFRRINFYFYKFLKRKKHYYKYQIAMHIKYKHKFLRTPVHERVTKFVARFKLQSTLLSIKIFLFSAKGIVCKKILTLSKSANKEIIFSTS